MAVRQIVANIVDQHTVDDMDLCAYLSQYAYNDSDDGDYRGFTIDEILNKSAESNGALSEDDILLAGRDKYGSLKLIAESEEYFQDTKVIAYAFYDERTKEVYVAYRGTGDGKWVDNGEGLYEVESEMQRFAKDFYDKVITEKLKDYPVDRIVVTGHSKGGNLAQYVTMASEYGHLVDRCYSFDGQGFSKEAYESFKKDLGDDFETQIRKMFSINGVNDYVHDLGIVIIPEDQTFFVETEGDGFGDFHHLFRMFKDGKLNIKLIPNADGTFSCPTEQGPIGKLAKEISAEMMKLEKEDLKNCALTVMSIIERYMNGGEMYKIGTGNIEFASDEDIRGFFVEGVPLLLTILNKTENLPEILEMFGLNADDVTWVRDAGEIALHYVECLVTIEDEKQRNAMLDLFFDLFETFMNDGADGVLDLLNDLDSAEEIGVFIAYTLKFIGDEKIPYEELVRILRESGIATVLEDRGIDLDSFIVKKLYEALLSGCEKLSTIEFIAMVTQIERWARGEGIDSWTGLVDYILDDPFRIIKLIEAVDFHKEPVRESFSKFFSIETISRLLYEFVCDHPYITTAGILAIESPFIRSILLTCGNILVSATIVAIAVNHIVKNWDTICKNVGEALKKVQEVVAKWVKNILTKVSESFNKWMDEIFDRAENLYKITKKKIHAAVENVSALFKKLKTNAINGFKNAFKLAKLSVKNSITRVVQYVTPVWYDTYKLDYCVCTMNAVSRRIQGIDSNLDKLYKKLAIDNIKKGENIFTSLVEMFNLAKADILVDDARGIRWRAEALEKLNSGYRSIEGAVSKLVKQIK